MKKFKWKRYPTIKKIPYKSPVKCWQTQVEEVELPDGTLTKIYKVL